MPRTCLILAVLALALLAAAQAAAQTVQRIAAVVNNEIISLQDLIERMDLAIVTSGLDDTTEMRQRIAPQVLRGMIDETLQLQEAERLGIPVQDQEVRQALATIAERNNLTPERLLALLAAEGVSERTLLRQLRAQVAWFKIVAREIIPRVVVAQEQIELALRELRQAEGQAELLLAEIVLPVYETGEEALVEADARRLVEAVREGASFAALASQFSAAPSAEDGGDIGWVPEGALPSELRAALAGLRPGEVSEPVASPVGYHVFLLRDRRQARAPGAADARVRLAQILFPLEGLANGGEATLAELRARASELVPRLDSCAEMERVADEIGAPMSGDLGWLRIADLPPALADAVMALPPERVSAPLPGPGGIHLLMVCERDEGAGIARLREEVADQLESEHIERLARRYLRDLRMGAFIDVRI